MRITVLFSFIFFVSSVFARSQLPYSCINYRYYTVKQNTGHTNSVDFFNNFRLLEKSNEKDSSACACKCHNRDVITKRSIVGRWRPNDAKVKYFLRMCYFYMYKSETRECNLYTSQRLFGSSYSENEKNALKFLMPMKGFEVGFYSHGRA